MPSNHYVSQTNFAKWLDRFISMIPKSGIPVKEVLRQALMIHPVSKKFMIDSIKTYEELGYIKIEDEIMYNKQKKDTKRK